MFHISLTHKVTIRMFSNLILNEHFYGLLRCLVPGSLSLKIHGGNVLGHETASYIWARSDANLLIVNVIYSNSSSFSGKRRSWRNPLKESALHKYLRSSRQKVRRAEEEEVKSTECSNVNALRQIQMELPSY